MNQIFQKDLFALATPYIDTLLFHAHTHTHPDTHTQTFFSFFQFSLLIFLPPSPFPNSVFFLHATHKHTDMTHTHTHRHIDATHTHAHSIFVDLVSLQN